MCQIYKAKLEYCSNISTILCTSQHCHCFTSFLSPVCFSKTIIWWWVKIWKTCGHKAFVVIIIILSLQIDQTQHTKGRKVHLWPAVVCERIARDWEKKKISNCKISLGQSFRKWKGPLAKKCFNIHCIESFSWEQLLYFIVNLKTEKQTALNWLRKQRPALAYDVVELTGSDVIAGGWWGKGRGFCVSGGGEGVEPSSGAVCTFRSVRCQAGSWRCSADRTTWRRQRPAQTDLPSPRNHGNWTADLPLCCRVAQ